MITIIKNGEVYSPEYLGKKDVVLVGNKIEGIYESIYIPKDFIDINVIDASGKLVLPGFIDSHVHILGGGGEGGFKTRTPEIQLSDLLLGGVTTVVGCLGTDGVCRDVRSLLAKARALDEEGITTYIYTGSYEIPVNTITGTVRSDVILIDKVIGAGEIAISDHRSSQCTFNEFVNVVAQARVGGILSGKAGITNVHIGDGKGELKYLLKMIQESDLPTSQVVPTHINRSEKVFQSGIQFAKIGGFVDLTTSSDPEFLEEGEVKASIGLMRMIGEGISVDQIMFSSDGQGSLPIYNKVGELIGIGIGSVQSLFREVKDAVKKDGANLEDAIKAITSNPARALKLSSKGEIEKGKDADIVIIDKDEFNIVNVIAKGREVLSEGKLLVRGTFEK